MRFLMMHRLDESLPEAWNPSQEFIEKMGAFIQDSVDKGILITAEGVHPSEKGSLVRKAGSRRHRDRRAVHRGQGGHRRLRADQRQGPRGGRRVRGSYADLFDDGRGRGAPGRRVRRDSWLTDRQMPRPGKSFAALPASTPRSTSSGRPSSANARALRATPGMPGQSVPNTIRVADRQPASTRPGGRISPRSPTNAGTTTVSSCSGTPPTPRTIRSVRVLAWRWRTPSRWVTRSQHPASTWRALCVATPMNVGPR